MLVGSAMGAASAKMSGGNVGKGAAMGAAGGGIGSGLSSLFGGGAGSAGARASGGEASAAGTAAGSSWSDLMKKAAIQSGTNAAVGAMTPQYGMSMPGSVPQMQQQDDPMVLLQQLMEQSKMKGARV